MKTTWSIIKSATGRKINNTCIQFLNIDGELTDNLHMITDFLNNYFLPIADKSNSNNAYVGHTTESGVRTRLYVCLQVQTKQGMEINAC